jgi:hypothetical protein
MKTAKSFLAGIVLFFVLTGNIFPDSAWAKQFALRYGRTSIVQLDSRNVLDAARSGSGGILFQAVALPEDKNLLGLPIVLAYDPKKDDGQRLSLSLGGATVVVKELYDWMLLPTANFADTSYYTCMTLLDFSIEGKTITEEEDNNWQKARELGGNLFRAGYHPALANTLVGLNCFFVDAMLIDTGMSGVTRAMASVKGFNAETNAFRDKFIAGLFEEDEGGAVSFALDYLEKQERAYADTVKQMFDAMGELGLCGSYIYSDCDVEIFFRIEEGNIVFTGRPYYQFINISDESDDSDSEYTKAEAVSNLFKENPEIIWNLGPEIYYAADQTARWAALFRYAKASNPAGWAGFMKQIGAKIRLEKNEYGDDEYRYDIETGPEDYLTPRYFISPMKLAAEIWDD